MAEFRTEVQNICHIFLPCHFFCTVSLGPVPEGTIALLSPWMSQEQHNATKERGGRGKKDWKSRKLLQHESLGLKWILPSARSAEILSLPPPLSVCGLMLSLPLATLGILCSPCSKKDKQNSQTHKISDVAFGRTYKFPVISTWQKEIGPGKLREKKKKKKIALFQFGF